MGNPNISPPSVEQIRDMLKAVIDPELGDNVVDLGMVGDITVVEQVVSIGFKLTIRGCPLRSQIKKDIESRLLVHPGVTKVTIDWGEMTAEERSAVMTRARWNARENASDTAIPPFTRVIAVASGKGGVGKTSMACVHALRMAEEGKRTLIVTTDPASNLADVFEQEIGHQISAFLFAPRQCHARSSPCIYQREAKHRSFLSN
jgi:ATP-binding protein involved in chromosome partitioning